MESHMGQLQYKYWREKPERKAGTNVQIGKRIEKAKWKIRKRKDYRENYRVEGVRKIR